MWLFVSILPDVRHKSELSKAVQQHVQRCDGKHSTAFFGNMVLFLVLKEIWESVKIWRSCHHEFGGSVFEYKDVTTHNKGQVGSRFGWHCARSDVFTMGEKLMERYCVTSAQYGGRYITWYSDNRLTSRSPYASLLGTAWLAGGRVCNF